jgi:hypothetical protein
MDLMQEQAPDRQVVGSLKAPLLATLVVFSPSTQGVTYETFSVNDCSCRESRPSGGPNIDRRPQIIQVNDFGERPIQREV